LDAPSDRIFFEDEDRLCKYVSEDGTRCAAYRMKNDPDGYCLFHSKQPEIIKMRRDVRNKGLERARAIRKMMSKYKLKEPKDFKKYLMYLLNKVHDDKFDKDRISYALKILDMFWKIQKFEDKYNEKLKKITKMLEEKQKAEDEILEDLTNEGDVPI